MRCLTLADALAARGWICAFITGTESTLAVPALREKKYDILSPDSPPDCGDLLVVDHYGLDAAYEKKARAWAKRIMVIDDLADRPHECDILLDQTYGRQAADYKIFVPPGCTVLVGADYALLRPGFAERRADSLRRRDGRLERVLVFISSLDARDGTSFVLEALNGLPFFLSVDVVLGSGAENLSRVRQMAEKSRHDITIHTDIADMETLMKQADLAIGAGGTASWERCCLGLPALVIEIADNQALIARELSKAGAVDYLGPMEDVSKDNIRQAILSLKNNGFALKAMSAAAARVCDGLGTERVIKVLCHG